MKKGLLGGKLRLSLRTSQRRPEHNVARWIGSKPQEARHLPVRRGGASGSTRRAPRRRLAQNARPPRPSSGTMPTLLSTEGGRADGRVSPCLRRTRPGSTSAGSRGARLRRAKQLSGLGVVSAGTPERRGGSDRCGSPSHERATVLGWPTSIRMRGSATSMIARIASTQSPATIEAEVRFCATSPDDASWPARRSGARARSCDEHLGSQDP